MHYLSVCLSRQLRQSCCLDQLSTAFPRHTTRCPTRITVTSARQRHPAYVHVDKQMGYSSLSTWQNVEPIRVHVTRNESLWSQSTTSWFYITCVCSVTYIPFSVLYDWTFNAEHELSFRFVNPVCWTRGIVLLIEPWMLDTSYKTDCADLDQAWIIIKQMCAPFLCEMQHAAPSRNFPETLLFLHFLFS